MHDKLSMVPSIQCLLRYFLQLETKNVVDIFISVLEKRCSDISEGFNINTFEIEGSDLLYQKYS